MSPLELPRPDDPELEVLYERELYEKCYQAALEAVTAYPHASARVIAEVWLQSFMLDALRGSLR